jgi:ATP-binding cassette subfamily B (MDR/TAP) protein 1
MLSLNESKTESILNTSQSYDDHSRKSLKEQIKENLAKVQATRVGFFKLMYIKSDRFIIFLIVLACLGSLIAGTSMPLISLVLGKVMNSFDGKIELSQVDGMVSGLIMAFLLVGVTIFIGSFGMVFFWTLVGRKLIDRINEDYFKTVMMQEQAYFDKKNVYEFSTTIQSQIKIIENGVNNFIILDWK